MISEPLCNSLRPPAVLEDTKRIPVPLRRLDAYLLESRIDRVDFIKLDVEGAEMEVLQGAAGLLSCKPRPLLMCELADQRSEPWGYRSVEIYKHLEGQGFHWFSLAHGGRLLPCPRKAYFHENLIAVPEESLGLVQAYAEGP